MSHARLSSLKLIFFQQWCTRIFCSDFEWQMKMCIGIPFDILICIISLGINNSTRSSYLRLSSDLTHIQSLYRWTWKINPLDSVHLWLMSLCTGELSDDSRLFYSSSCELPKGLRPFEFVDTILKNFLFLCLVLRLLQFIRTPRTSPLRSFL